MITKVRKYFPNMPIWITENGVADATDEKRTRYIRDHFEHDLQAHRQRRADPGLLPLDA